MTPVHFSCEREHDFQQILGSLNSQVVFYPLKPKMLEVLPTFLKSVSKEESKCILYLMLSLLFSLVVAQIMILGGKMAKMATP